MGTKREGTKIVTTHFILTSNLTMYGDRITREESLIKALDDAVNLGSWEALLWLTENVFNIQRVNVKRNTVEVIETVKPVSEEPT